MSRIWIKLYLETLDDPKMGRLDDHLWRRCVEFFLLAGKVDRDGLLPTVEEMAWSLRAGVEEVLQRLSDLENLGIVRKSGKDWVVVNFRKRQYSESYERVKRYRNGRSNADSNADEAEKWSTSTSTSTSTSDSSSSEEGEGTGEGTRVPSTQKESAQHPDIQLFQEITGWFPGETNWMPIVHVFAELRKRGLNLREYLPEYWLAWSTRTGRNGKPYSKNSPVWYAEWAMSGKIPSANGHEPRLGEQAKENSKRSDVIRKVARRG